MSRILFIAILLIFSCEERESEDCAGVVGGDAKEDNCKVCDTDSSNDCIQDCAGVWGGTAVIGGCDSTCDSVAEVDDCDVCTGNIYYVAGSCYDCNDVPNGPASLDNCDTCDDDPTNDCEADCAGVFGGTQLDTDSDGTCDAVIDIDENIYMTITIGEQVWISENIKVTHYNNQEEILNGNSDGNWIDLSDGAYAVYPSDNGDASTCGDNCANVYGNLYNWYAVNDERGICPAGWHVPTDDDYTVLTNNLGGSSVAGGKMKETGADHWDNPNLGATNESGFTALPSGYYSREGFNHLINTGYFWSSTDDINYNTQAFGQFVDADTESLSMITSSKSSYYSIRCLKN